MFNKDHEYYKAMVIRSHEAVAALWENYADTKEALTCDHPSYLTFGAKGLDVLFYFEFQSTTISVNYDRQPAEILERLRSIDQWENLIPPLILKVVSAAEEFFGSEVMEKYDTAFNIKTTFTKAYTGDFEINPFDKLILSCGITITDLPPEDAVELLTIIQMIAFLADVELSKIIHVEADPEEFDFIFGNA